MFRADFIARKNERRSRFFLSNLIEMKVFTSDSLSSYLLNAFFWNARTIYFKDFKVKKGKFNLEFRFEFEFELETIESIACMFDILVST